MSSLNTKKDQQLYTHILRKNRIGKIEIVKSLYYKIINLYFPMSLKISKKKILSYIFSEVINLVC